MCIKEELLCYKSFDLCCLILIPILQRPVTKEFQLSFGCAYFFMALRLKLENVTPAAHKEIKANSPIIITFLNGLMTFNRAL